MRIPRGRRPAAVAAALFLLSAAAALAFVAAYPLPAVENDAVGYLAAARNVASGAGFTQDGATPWMYRPPLFSLLLGGWFSLTGTSSVLSAAVFQSVLHGAGVVAAFLLFLELAPSLAWAAGAALFLAVNPLLVTRVVFVLQEPTTLLSTTLAAWCSVRLVRGPSTVRAALSGVAWGVCTLGKVVTWFAPFLLLAMRLLPERLRWKWRKGEAAALLLCFVAAIAPWTVRNYLHSHRFIPVNAQGEGMLEWNVSNAEIPGERPGSEYVAREYRRGASEGERKAVLWRYVFDHPGYFFGRRIVRNAVHFAGPPKDWWIARGIVRPGERGTGYWILAGGFHVPLYLLLFLRSRRWWVGGGGPALGPAVLLYWAYWGQHALVWGDPRFGLAVYPLLVGIAIAGSPAGVSPSPALRVPPLD